MSNEILVSIKKRLKLPAVVAPMFLVSGPDAVIQSCKEGHVSIIYILTKNNYKFVKY